MGNPIDYRRLMYRCEAPAKVKRICCLKEEMEVEGQTLTLCKNFCKLGTLDCEALHAILAQTVNPEE